MIDFIFIFISLLQLTRAKTVSYDWSIGWVLANPDGELTRPVIGINGKWPLPPISADVGDTIVVTAHNNLGNESTSLHWHGLYQSGTAAQDGPVGVTQCGIPPGSSLTYSFTVKQPGTYFYHSHAHGQYPDGLRGPILIHDPASPYAGQITGGDLVMTLSDWYHDQVPKLTQIYLSADEDPDGSEPVPYSALVNDGRETQINVLPGKTYFLRIINMAAFAQMFVKFDQHEMTIIEVDGIYTKPQVVQSLYISTAQRYGVLLKTKSSKSQNYAATIMMDSSKFDDVPAYLNTNQTAYLVYDSSKPMPHAPIVNQFAVFDDINLVPYDMMPLLRDPDQTITLNLDFFERDGQNRAGFNNITYIEQKVPTLFTALTTGADALNPAVYGVNANAFVLKQNSIIEIVINNFDEGAHPLHIHGHAAQLILRAAGTYKPPGRHHNHGPSGHGPSNKDVMGYNGNQAAMKPYPMRRDTWEVEPSGYTVLRFKADNPGVWFLHCHMDWHLSAGLAATFIESPDVLQRTQQIPSAWLDLCKSQGVPTAGNAAGNTRNHFDLTGANTVCPPLANM